MLKDHSSPYMTLSDENLLAEMQNTDDYITQASKHLEWLEEHDTDTGYIDTLRYDLDHACADYQWLQKELFYRGFSLNLETKIWEQSVL